MGDIEKQGFVAAEWIKLATQLIQRPGTCFLSERTSQPALTHPSRTNFPVIPLKPFPFPLP